MADTAIFPLALWASGTNQNSIPANDNSIRLRLLNGNIISRITTAQPVSPADGDAYILPSTHTGTQWATFSTNSLVIYVSGTWYAWAPVNGITVNVNGVIYYYDGGTSSWRIAAGRTPNEQVVASAATVTPTFADDLVKITAQAVGLTLANWSGTATSGWGMVIRVKDNGSPQTIAYGANYRAVGVTLPTTTVAGKTLYFCCIWNSDDSKIDVLSVAQEA